MVATGTPEGVTSVRDGYARQYPKEPLGRRGPSGSKTAKPSKRTPRKKAEAAE